jgi:hypothetical protein
MQSNTAILLSMNSWVARDEGKSIASFRKNGLNCRCGFTVPVPHSDFWGAMFAEMIKVNKLSTLGRISLIITFIFIASVSCLTAEEFIRYTDANGTQVITNIPPSNYPVSKTSSRDWAPDRKPDTEKPPAEISNPEPENTNRTFDSLIDKYARHYELDPSLIHSIIATESGFNPNAVSPKGACGLMQLMPATADRLGVKDSFDPEQNIRAGVRHFRSLMDTFNNNLALSLAAYNAGENLVRRLGRIPEIKETVDYVQSVTRRYNEKQKNDQAFNDENSEPEPVPTFRFVDASGVVNLTNIPSIH